MSEYHKRVAEAKVQQARMAANLARIPKTNYTRPQNNQNIANADTQLRDATREAQKVGVPNT